MRRFLTYTLLLFSAFTIALAILPQDAYATDIDILPAKSTSPEEHEAMLNAATHPPLRLTPDKSEIVTLEGEATSVIIGNPYHLSVVADSNKNLLFVGRAPGATFVNILDKDGKPIMQRHVIVASPKSDYVRIRQSCVGQKAGCQPVAMYYCPNSCHEVHIDSESKVDPSAQQNAMDAEKKANAASDPYYDPTKDSETN